MSSLTYYIEYHYAGRLHPFGFRLPVNDDVALLGRDPQATVRFYDDTPTVSRRHALIRRQNGQYILEPLSPTNSTLLNGQRIFRPTVLRSGDEIRLSTDGPRLGVIFPSEPLRRFQSADAAPLPGNVAAKPPRQSRSALLWFVAILAAAAIGFGVWKIAELSSANRRLDEIVARQAASQSEPQQSSTGNPTADNGGAGRRPSAPSQAPAAGGSPSEAAMKEADKSVYYVMALGFEVTTPYGHRYEIKCGNGSGQIPGWSGTGFLLSDGRFVTARHVVEPWYFLDGGDTSREMLSLNILAGNGGKVVARFGAVSSTGDQILLLLSGKKRQNHIFSTNIISYTCFTKKGLSFEAM